ncbi:MAG: hypothetical protein A2X31_13155 [Elusimicrobia bacterium GWB2_63_22]|nr:MAG: hypothetical protein A2X31_13155 [Elusimicrobia bacterium GWB2_63_22]
MNCPKCGTAIEEGKAYCSNPACGAVTGAGVKQTREIKLEKELKFKLVMDFAVLARLGALLIVILAAAYLYFFVRG